MKRQEYRIRYIGSKIREIRTEKGYSQQELSNKCNGAIARTTIFNYENANIAPTISGLYTIADALEVSIIDLLPKEEIKYEKKENTPIAALYQK